MKINNIKTKKTMFLIVFTIAVWWLFDNFKIILNLLKILLEVLQPFMIALAIAFIVNKPMTFIENKLFKDFKLLEKLDFKYKRAISLVLTLILLIVLIIIFLAIIIPNLVQATSELSTQVPVYFEQFQKYIKTTPLNDLKISEWIQKIDTTNLTKSLTNFFKGGLLDIVNNTFGVFSSAFSIFTTIFLGTVFSIYFLLQKEDLIKSIKKLTFAIFPIKVSNRLVYLSQITEESFSSFITGQSIDAILIGSIFFVSMLIFRFPYALMISITIGLFALIPIVGAFIGFIVGVFLIFVEDPQKALYFSILFIIIQQLEGDLIYPKVVGNASGLSSIWILAAVAIGGSLFGILGIILFVPLFSIIQKLLKEFIDKRLANKELTEL